MPPLYDHPEVSEAYFFPMPGGPLPRTAEAAPVDVHLPDGTRVGCYWSRPLPGAPCLLYLHGNGECIEDQLGHWPAWAAEAGANILFVDYPGYATSDGQPSLTACCEAARAALRLLLDAPPAQVPRVLLLGRSVGSIFALDAAAGCASDRLAGLALESGVADLQPRLALRVDYRRLGLDQRALEAELRRDFDHRRKLAALRCPVLVLHTRDDGLVPCANAEQLAAWAGPRLHRLVLFEHGDHNGIQLFNGAAYRAHLRAFVQAACGPRPAVRGS